MKNPNLRQTMFGFIFYAVTVSILIYINPVASNITYLTYLVALVLIIMALGFLLFNHFDFDYVRKHIRYNRSGPAVVKKMDNGLFVSLGELSPTNTAFFVNLAALPKSIHYWGRWTKYQHPSGLELWHDHPLFGSGWYYISH